MDERTKVATTETIQAVIDTTKAHIAAVVSAAYKPKGTVAFADLPPADAAHLNYMYNVSDSFTTTEDFTGGAGIEMPAGTDVSIINDGDDNTPVYKYNCLAGKTDLSAYQTKRLAREIHGETTVEDAMAVLDTAENRLSDRMDSVEPHLLDTENPHSVTAKQVGLGNVANVGTDASPTMNSRNNVESGGVFSALENKVDKVSGKGLSDQNFTYEEKTKLSNLSNYDDTALSGRVTENEAAIATLNGGKETEGSVDKKIADALETITGFDFKIVETLPAAGEKGVIYLVAQESGAEKDAYEEYIWITDGWEYLGKKTIQIDLSDYAKKSEVTTVVGVKNDKIAVSDADNAALTDTDTVLSADAGENPTAMKSNPLSKLWAYIKGKISGVLGLTETAYGGTSAHAGALGGFSRTEAATWGTQTGTVVCGGSDGDGGDFVWRKNNPAPGQLSLVVDGTVYVGEGLHKVLDDGGGQTVNGILYFDDDGESSKDRMAVGRGKPPRQFVDMNDTAYNRLVEGAYLVFGDDETGGIIAGGDGIDLWAPPDYDLVRFWNEDDSAVSMSIGGQGQLYTNGCRRGKKGFTSTSYGDTEIRIDFDEGMDESDYILTFEFTRGAEYVTGPVLVRSKDSDGFDVTVYHNSEDEFVEFEWCAQCVYPGHW